MTSVTAFSDEYLTTHLNTLIIPDQVDMKMEIGKGGQTSTLVNDGVCAICLDDIHLQETALIKGCEHAYCCLVSSFVL
ncbi:E3 ubiquitin-protein ligase ZNRF4 [Bienertia sinuspersici]